MRWLLWIIMLAAAAVGLVLAARASTGYVLLVMPPYRVELSIAFAALCGIAGLIAGYLAVRALVVTVTMPSRVRAFQQRRAQNKARETFAEALRNYFEGRLGKAQSYLEASLSIEPTYSAHLELARLHESTGKPEAAAAQYREALSLTLSQLKQLTGGRRRPAI